MTARQSFMVAEGKLKQASEEGILPPLWMWQIGNIVFLCGSAFVVSSDNDKRLDQDTSLAAQNFLAPAGWAFVIWPVIYLLEFPFLLWQLGQWVNCACVPKYRLDALRAFSIAFCAGQTFQAFWALTFRYEYKTPGLLWISTLNLAGIAVCFSFSHRAAAAAATMGWQELLFMYPGLTMHFGWTTAAALVNTNAWVSLCTTSPALKLCAVLVSVLAAAGIGLAVGIGRDSLLYACTICYALTAVGTRTIAQPEIMVAGLGSLAATLLGSFELIVGVGIVAATLFAKFQRMKDAQQQEGGDVEAS